MTELYLWFKTLHILSLVAWAGSMLLLPWLFVMLIKLRANPDKELLLLEIIRLLIRRVINAAMIATYLTGIGLIWVLMQSGVPVMQQGWLHSKIALALVLSVCHGLLSRSRRCMVKYGEEPKTLHYYYTVALVTGLSILGAVFFAVQKPM